MTTEAAVLAAVRLEYARRGYRLFRNNSGQLRRTEPTYITPDMVGTVRNVEPLHAQPVRFGLGNDSPQINAVLKSSDLIGWNPTLVTSDMVGTCVARFVSFECKPSDWRLTPGDKRAQAQNNWLRLVLEGGGDARFMTGVDDT